MTPWIIALFLGLIAGIPLMAIGLTPHWREDTIGALKWTIPLCLLLPLGFDMELTGLYIQSTTTKLFLCAVLVNTAISMTLVCSKQYNLKRGWCHREGCRDLTHEQALAHRDSVPSFYVGRWFIRRRMNILVTAIMIVVTIWSCQPQTRAISEPWAMIPALLIYLAVISSREYSYPPTSKRAMASARKLTAVAPPTA